MPYEGRPGNLLKRSLQSKQTYLYLIATIKKGGSCRAIVKTQSLQQYKSLWEGNTEKRIFNPSLIYLISCPLATNLFTRPTFSQPLHSP